MRPAVLDRSSNVTPQGVQEVHSDVGKKRTPPKSDGVPEPYESPELSRQSSDRTRISNQKWTLKPNLTVCRFVS